MRDTVTWHIERASTGDDGPARPETTDRLRSTMRQPGKMRPLPETLEDLQREDFDADRQNGFHA